MRAAAGLLLALLPGLAAAETVAVRSGNHAGFGRLVVAWPAVTDYTVQQQDERLDLRFPPGSSFALPARLPRNVLGLAPEGSGLRLLLRPGARVKHYRLDSRLVVDVLDPPAAAPATTPAASASVEARRAGRRKGGAPEAALVEPAPPAEAAPAPRRKAGTAVVPSRPMLPEVLADGRAGPAAPAAATAIPRPAPAPPAAAPAPPDSRAAPPPMPRQPAMARLLHNQGVPALLLPFPAGTGAALLRRGDQMLALFDSPEAPDLAPLRGDPAFGALEAERLPGATLLRLPLAPTLHLRARQDPAGWRLEALPQAAPTRPVGLETEAGPPPRLVLKAASPGRVVPILDPETGLPLLLGTLRAEEGAVLAARRLPELDLPPTLLGVAVLARSDGIVLQAGTDRFTLASAGGGRLALDPAAIRPAPGQAMTRSFELPDQPAAELLSRLQGLQAGIAGAAPLARLPQRRAAGETLLALGLPQEAQAMLRLGFAEDPRAATDPGYAALAAAAALLAGRLGETGALRSRDWPDTDEAVLWRAALSAAQADWQSAGPGLVASLPLLLAYPAALRARLLPMAALALAEAGEGPALRRLIEAGGPEPDDLLLPRAMLAEAEGRPVEALAAYDRVIAGRDRQARARALRRAVDLRLAAGHIDAAQAAKALEAALFAWRGDAQEVELRLRLATLRQQAGDARGALALLQETAAAMPDQAARLLPPIRDAFVAALAEAPPLVAVGLFDAYPEMLSGDARFGDSLLLVADRLQALDLGDRAAALLAQGMQRAGGATRAALGHRLASLRLAEGDAAGALAALSDSAAPDLPTLLAQERTVLAARAEARRGRVAEATAALRTLGPAGGEALSELLTDGADWAGAAAALDGYLAVALPAPPAPIEDRQRRLLLRQAALLALAGEDAALGRLRAAQAGRMGHGALAEAFQVLTADPLRGLADLPRLQRELRLFRALPGRLEALRAGAPVTR
ncbi:hypothetical protein [Roseicella aquatilis]|uniref:Tetratricopeptide repeat protein n=1 Tax=Roseicella aquatilis TaxID=2527868 RepID=A0A4R4DPA2_9PROT|nr:hypothetical protein [Roseicella aquatilis]TCZ63654.1 hypothetical protein EXY23_09730 [Roseicella aquatilis]